MVGSPAASRLRVSARAVGHEPKGHDLCRRRQPRTARSRARKKQSEKTLLPIARGRHCPRPMRALICNEPGRARGWLGGWDEWDRHRRHHGYVVVCLCHFLSLLPRPAGCPLSGTGVIIPCIIPIPASSSRTEPPPAPLPHSRLPRKTIPQTAPQNHTSRDHPHRDHHHHRQHRQAQG